ncbi:MAG: ABC transporter ATP-binding protein [Traorella sp.]
MELLRVNDLTKIYIKNNHLINAVDHVSFCVSKGSFIAITGESGSGKSTLLHMLAGLENPTQGEIILDQTNIYSFNEDQLTIFRRRQIGMVYQFYNLIPTLNAKENILLPILLDHKEVDESYFNQIISSLHIENDLLSYPNSLSGGQQQRVALARALIHHPSLLLCDEPTGNLDSTNTHEIIDLLKLMSNKYDTTIILITHDMNVAMQADEVYYMKDGQLSIYEE